TRRPLLGGGALPRRATAAARPGRGGGRAARAPRACGARAAGERRAARRLPLGRARLDRGHGRHPLRRRRAQHLRPRLRGARLPAGVRRALAAAAPALGAPQGNTTVRYLLRRFLEEADLPAPARHRAWTGCVDAAHLAALATPGGPLALPPEPVALPARSAIDALLALDLTGYLTDDLLPKLDRASMAASLEGRAPFLDHRLVEFACRLPVELKVRGLATKQVLRKAVADLVPPPIRRRVKRGLTVP